MLDQPGSFGSKDVFGTPENFEPYRIISLLKARAEMFADLDRHVPGTHGHFALAIGDRFTDPGIEKRT